MCVAVPGKVMSVADDGTAVVDMLGNELPVSTRLTPRATVGDYVLVHAGFAIEVVDPGEAEETIGLFREIAGAE